MFMEKYHDQKKETFLNEHFEPDMVEKWINIDRAMKNAIWKQNMKT